MERTDYFQRCLGNRFFEVSAGRTDRPPDGNRSDTSVTKPDASRTFQLGGLDSAATYTVDVYGGTPEDVPGSELANRTVQLEPRAFQLIFYQKR